MTLNCKLLQLLFCLVPQHFSCPRQWQCGRRVMAPVVERRKGSTMSLQTFQASTPMDGVGIHLPASWSACRAQVNGATPSGSSLFVDPAASAHVAKGQVSRDWPDDARGGIALAELMPCVGVIGRPETTPIEQSCWSRCLELEAIHHLN